MLPKRCTGGASRKFPGWDMSLLPLSLLSQRLSDCCKHLSRCRFVSLFSRACFSAWISAISSRLCRFNLVFIFWNKKAFEIKFLSCLAWSCRYLRTWSLIFFVVFNKGAQMLQQSASCLNLRFRFVCKYRVIDLECYIVNLRLSSTGMTLGIFSTFYWW